MQAIARLKALSMSTGIFMRCRIDVKESLAKLGIYVEARNFKSLM